MLKDNKQLSVAFLEISPIVISAMLWGSEWVGKKILFYCDNEATVHIINKGIQFQINKKQGEIYMTVFDFDDIWCVSL